MRWLHAVFPIIEATQVRSAASREEVSSSPEPQGVPLVGMWRVGYVSGVHGACSQRFVSYCSRKVDVRRLAQEE